MTLSVPFTTSKSGALNLVAAYLTAKEQVIQAGFAYEIDWQYRVKFEGISESTFLREAAWVILSAGMREQIIRKKFPVITKAFKNWKNASYIVAHRDECRRQAMSVFGHDRKIDSIIGIAEEISEDGFPMVINQLEQKGVQYLQSLPFMGPATSFHLAKNIGLSAVKPDRHLCRIAEKAGYCCPEALCDEIARTVGEKLPVIDVVIWRYANLNRDYLSMF